MATVGNNNPTLMDFTRREDSDHKIAQIIELLNETNEIIQDMVVVECNDGTSHITTIRTGLPAVAFRMLNYGVQPSKSTTRKVSDTTGMLEAYAEVDKALADLNNNTAEFRLSEDRAFLEAMSQEMAETLFYGDTSVNSEKFLGLMYRFNESSTDKDTAGYQVIEAGTAAGTDPNTNTSIWIVVWGKNTVHGIYPKGSTMGFSHKDLGEQTLTDDDGGYYQGYRAHYKWDLGLSVRDYRYVVRICNLDLTQMTDAGEDGYNGPAILQLLIKGIHRIHNMRAGKAVIYMNDEVLTLLDLIANYDSRLALRSVEDVDGKPMLKFRGIPIRRVDQIINTEEEVTAAS